MLLTALLSRHKKKEQNAQLLQAEKSQKRVIAQKVAAETDSSHDSGVLEKEEAPPLTFTEAQALLERLRGASTLMSPQRVIVWQFVVACCLTIVAWLALGRLNVVASVAYGAVAVIVPSAVFAYGLAQSAKRVGAVAVGMRFFMWEAVKICLTVVMLYTAPRWVSDLSWLALLAGFVVTMKVYWAAIWFGSRRKHLGESPVKDSI